MVTCGLPYMLVLELCSVGELKQYLVDTPRHDILQMYSFAMDIAEGMEHLAAAGFVHRDLACRNVLLNEALDAKIADFGMGRDLQESEYDTPLLDSHPHKCRSAVLLCCEFGKLTQACLQLLLSNRGWESPSPSPVVRSACTRNTEVFRAH